MFYLESNTDEGGPWQCPHMKNFGPGEEGADELKGKDRQTRRI
jgi:hypothetical protein